MRKYCAPAHWGSTQQFDHTSFMLLCYTEVEKKKKAPLLSLTLLSFLEFICFLTLMVFSSKQESDLYRQVTLDQARSRGEDLGRPRNRQALNSSLVRGDLEPLILRSLSPECWGYKHVLGLQVCAWVTGVCRGCRCVPPCQLLEGRHHFNQIGAGKLSWLQRTDHLISL